MKNLDSIPHILKGIFSDLTNETNVRVALKPSNNPETSGNPASGIGYQASDIRHPASDIWHLEVNGCNTPMEFYNQLNSLCSQVRLSIVDTLSELEDTEKAVMLIEAFNRVGILSQKISTIILPSNATGETEVVYVQLKGFNQMTIHTGSDQIAPPSATNPSLLFQLAPFARHMKNSLMTLSHQLIDLTILHEHHKDICRGETPKLPASPPPMVKKLRLRVSVSLSAAFIRILYDDNVFEIPNKSEFCRIFAALISTAQQEEVSPLSLRNHFNSPSHDCLAYIDAKLTDWRNQIRKLMVLN